MAMHIGDEAEVATVPTTRSTRLRDEARAALSRGDRQQAAALAERLIREGDDVAEGLFVSAMVAAEAGRVSAALPLVAEAVRRAPTAEYEAHHARLLIHARCDAEAAAAATRAEARAPRDALTFDTIGCVWTRLGDHGAAARLFAQAVAHDGANLDFRYNLGAALGFLGRTEEASAQFEAIIAASPADGRAHYALSGLRRHNAGRNHIPRLEAALTNAEDPADRLRIRYALGKECEECDRPAEAFGHLKAANDAHRAAIGYHFDQDVAIFDAIEGAFADGSPLAGEGTSEAAPIFVTGMPRTGTTLVDRILSSHPMVRSAGELQAMPLGVKLLSGSTTRRIVDADTIAAMRGRPADELARAYLARALPHVGQEAARFTDKLPANFLYIGFIAAAFPAARIVCLRRDPMDTVWSNYRHLFATTSPYYAYSYDPADIARYWLRFDRLMAFWQARVPGRVLELSYEALVADQEGETRRLLAHCGLDWDGACLDFHRNAAAVSTPSAAQVRRPISGDAIGRWRLHEAGLAQAKATLEAAGVAV
jgi:tetratricopeptide (TPR) repeat protein